MRALVVDDVPEIRELISVLLTSDGFRIEAAAESAEEAFEQLRLEEPGAAATVDVNATAEVDTRQLTAMLQQRGILPFDKNAAAVPPAASR